MTNQTIKYEVFYNPEPFNSRGRYKLAEAVYSEDAIFAAGGLALIWGATWVDEVVGRRRKVIHRVPSLTSLGPSGEKAEVKFT